MERSKVKLKSNGDTASPCFRNVCGCKKNHQQMKKTA